jgi:hypothetical protein
LPRWKFRSSEEALPQGVILTTPNEERGRKDPGELNARNILLKFLPKRPSRYSEPIERMSADPQQFPTIYQNVRRALLRRFPFALMFVIGPDDTPTVIACFHGSRDPGYWQKRA